MDFRDILGKMRIRYIIAQNGSLGKGDGGVLQVLHKCNTMKNPTNGTNRSWDRKMGFGILGGQSNPGELLLFM